MSTFSLPHLLNGGGGVSSGSAGRHKAAQPQFASLNRFAPKPMTASRLSVDANGSAGGARARLAAPPSKQELLMARRKTLNRNGSIARNQFRGIKKQMLETQTEMLLHTMTVSLEAAAALVVS